ncbi:MAG: hypothetical protein GXO29_05965 [Thermotogae bacterium]|nr:hypothetical protein [Thermotogota bacterium]
MEVFDIYVEALAEEMLPLEEFLRRLKEGRYGQFSEDDIREFREILERNVSESAHVKGAELGIPEGEVYRVIEENILDIRATFERVFGWL